MWRIASIIAIFVGVSDMRDFDNHRIGDAIWWRAVARLRAAGSIYAADD